MFPFPQIRSLDLGDCAAYPKPSGVVRTGRGSTGFVPGIEADATMDQLWDVPLGSRPQEKMVLQYLP